MRSSCHVLVVLLHAPMAASARNNPANVKMARIGAA
jgi:hypothetical protein